MPFSPGIDPNDPKTADPKDFLNKRLIFTIKMDGSNSVIRKNELPAARNGSHAKHPSFNMLKGIAPTVWPHIPENHQVFGEWLYAQHSIEYCDKLALDAYWQVISVCNMETKMWWPWGKTYMWCKESGVAHVRVVAFGLFKDVESLERESMIEASRVIGDGHEGLVIRTDQGFHLNEFPRNVAKIVRENHVQTDQHWSHQKIIKNDIKTAN